MAVYRKIKQLTPFIKNKALSNKSEPSMKRETKNVILFGKRSRSDISSFKACYFLKISYTVKGVIFTYEIHILFHLRSGATTVVLQGVDEKKRKIKPNWRKHNMAVISMKQLLEAGVHFGHQTRRWNPKMKKYIFTERNGIYIIDLQKQ